MTFILPPPLEPRWDGRAWLWTAVAFVALAVLALMGVE